MQSDPTCDVNYQPPIFEAWALSAAPAVTNVLFTGTDPVVSSLCQPRKEYISVSDLFSAHDEHGVFVHCPAEQLLLQQTMEDAPTVFVE